MGIYDSIAGTFLTLASGTTTNTITVKKNADNTVTLISSEASYSTKHVIYF